MVYLKDNPNNAFVRSLSAVIRRPLGLFLFALPLMAEAWLTSPEYFSLYIDNVHGWLMGLIYFFLGFLFISCQDVFWPAVERSRWIALLLASSLYVVRLVVFDLQHEIHWLTALESLSWVLAILGFGSLHLNQSSRTLRYLSRSVYPVYIVHLPIQFVICYLLFPLSLSAWWKLALLLVGTFGMSLLLYEWVLRRLTWIRPLFGMKLIRSGGHG
jgi:hypothetical protein